MRARISFFVGIIVAGGAFASRAVSEDAKSSGLIYTPWTKFCVSGMCLIGNDARTASDCMSRFAAVLVERTGETKKTLRVLVPASVDRARGVRIAIDQDQPIEGRVGGCYANLCSAEIEGGAELIARLKRGHKLVFDAVGANGPMRFELPLADFATAYDGPPQEPKVFEAQSGKLQEELRTQADADRKIQCDAN